MHSFYISVLYKFLLTHGLVVNVVSAVTDYCDPKFCPNQGTHVACINSEEFSNNCTGEYKVEDIEPHIKLILQEHNAFRNELASGELGCFYPATRMPILIWDEELAKIATYNVKTCEFGHDQCRSTSNYPYVGQNIYYARTTRLNISVEEFIREAIYMWYDEYNDADYTVVEKFNKTSPQSGHFTVLVNDRQNKIGCAFLNNLQTQTTPLKRVVIFTCNYPSTNIRGLPTYKPGPTASECEKIDKEYTALCDDVINPNDIYWYEKDDY